MDFELKQLGQTLAVGAFAVLGFWLIFRLFEQRLFKNKNKGGEDINLEQVKFVLNGLILAFIFAIGIVLENISKHIVAVRDPPFKKVRDVLGTNLKTDKETRFDILFDTIDVNKFELSALGKRMKIEKYFQDFVPMNIQDSINKDSFFTVFHAKTDSKLNTCNEIYYNAKDRVYQEGNFFNELSTISTRMDFLRAFVFLLQLLLYLIVAAFIIKTIVIFINNKVSDKYSWQALLSFFVLCFLLIKILPTAYEAECSNYNMF